MMNSSMKMVLRSMVTTMGKATVLGGMDVLCKVGVQEAGAVGNRYFAKGGGDKRGPNAGKKTGPAGKILVVEPDGGFAASVIKRGADKPGAESGNPIWSITRELSPAAFEARYSKAGKHIKAANSAGKFTMMYGIEPTKMAAHSVLGAIVFRRIYLIHPHYTDWVKLGIQEQAVVDALAAGAPKTPEKALEEEMTKQEDKDVIKKNETHLESLVMNAVKMMDRDSRLILLHGTDAPYSEWDLKTVAAKFKLETETVIPFAKDMYPGFEARREGTDLKLKLESSAFHWFRFIRD